MKFNEDIVRQSCGIDVFAAFAYAAQASSEKGGVPLDIRREVWDFFKTGMMLTWGCGSLCRTGHGVETNTEEPTLVTSTRRWRVLSVSCGHTHGLMRTAEGLYGWGSNCCGQLGMEGSYVKMRPSLIKPPTHPDALCVWAKCGSLHSVVRWDNQVFGFGRNTWNQLGNNEAQNIFKPTLMDLEPLAMDCAAGDRHTVFRCEGNAIYACGSNAEGQCGLALETETVENPTKVTFFDGKHVRLIASGGFCTAVLCNDGIYYLGTNYSEHGIAYNVVCCALTDRVIKSITSLSCNGVRCCWLTLTGMHSFSATEAVHVGKAAWEAYPTAHSEDDVAEHATCIARGGTHSLVVCQDYALPRTNVVWTVASNVKKIAGAHKAQSAHTPPSAHVQGVLKVVSETVPQDGYDSAFVMHPFKVSEASVGHSFSAIVLLP